MLLFDYKCSTCGIVAEKLVHDNPDSRPAPKCECGSDMQRQFPTGKMQFELKNAKWSMCGWSYDGYSHRAPTHEVFKEDGSYQDNYERKHQAGGTPIFDQQKGV